MFRGQLAILSSLVMLALAHAAQAQTINLSLNLHYKNSADPAMGGNWMLVAKTDSLHGIAGINAIISNINFGATVLQPGIGAMPIETSQDGTKVEFVYFQDLGMSDNVVTNV